MFRQVPTGGQIHVRSVVDVVHFRVPAPEMHLEVVGVLLRGSPGCLENQMQTHNNST